LGQDHRIKARGLRRVQKRSEEWDRDTGLEQDCRRK